MRGSKQLFLSRSSDIATRRKPCKVGLNTPHRLDVLIRSHLVVHIQGLHLRLVLRIGRASLALSL